MIKVGLTGGIGSGKTYVSNIFEVLGIPIYNSDLRAKQLMNKDAGVKAKLIAAFGEEVYTKGELNRAYLAKEVFSHKEKVKTVNQIVHPAVGKDFESWVEENAAKPYLIKEAAILIETGIYKSLDYLVVVTAPRELRIQRVCKRDKVTAEQVIQRLNHQISDAERIKYADFVIENDGTKLAEEQVKQIHNTILNNIR